MLNLGMLAFSQAWLLLALIALPAIWLLLRATPPAPRRQLFPAARLLFKLDAPEETPARTPWWLLLLRLLIAALIILAVAGPILNPAARLAGGGPLLLVVDDGFAAAADWPARQEQIGRLLTQAERDGREVVLLRTAPDPNGQVRLSRMSAGQAIEALPGWTPRPWPTDRKAALAALGDLQGDVSAVWVSDGTVTRAAENEDVGRVAAAIRQHGPLQVLSDAGGLPPMLLPPDLSGDRLQVHAVLPAPGPERSFAMRALGPTGEVLGRAPLDFAAGSTGGSGSFDLPLDLRNKVARIELSPRAGIGGVVLLDERWRRRTVGIVGEAHAAADQPLLSETYFLERALLPFATLKDGSIDALTAAPLSLMILPDMGELPAEQRDKLTDFIDKGGVLLRFAGPRLAASGDSLVPVPLRAGDRQLGGALSWSEPLPIAHFNPAGPFAGLVPNAEATVSRQVLAEPGPALAAATFASLSDGTPLVTGKRMGKGWLLLVHTTANTSWNSLPLSGLFIDMLRRVLTLAPGVGGAPTGNLQASATLDATGDLQPAPAGLEPVPAASFAQQVAGPRHPPGLYAPPVPSGQEDQVARSALNLQSAVPDYQAAPASAFGGEVQGFARASEVDLSPWLLLVAFILGLIDLVLGYALRGLVPRLRRSGASAATVALILGLGLTAVPGVALAQSSAQQGGDHRKAMEAALNTQLAYVVTGDSQVDAMSRAGLTGLGTVLGMRTSIETVDPAPLDLATDDLAAYPFIYWPMPPDFPDLSDAARERVEAYLRQGGMILFDTKDAGQLLPGQVGGGPGEQRLAQVLKGLDLPPLIQVPADHVLTRSFYLLQDFPGRWTGQPVWVDQVPASINDGVSSVIIGANDWAGAWATDELGNSLLPVVPGGENQREMARRFGVNVVMYALTGNYKTDQVHVPALLERLGQ